MSDDLRIAVFADGASYEPMIRRYHEGFVKGFTTNPSLMRKAGVEDYESFARRVLEVITDRPISFEVFSDDLDEMDRQARYIASWGRNVNVKIPITNTRRVPTVTLIQRLLRDGIPVNVTAVLTAEQIQSVREAVRPDDQVILSIFAGRIADTGVDPVPMMTRAVELFRDAPGTRILWASPREVLNIYQADACGCHIITATDDLIARLALRHKDLAEYSLDTVKMFHEDARAAGYRL